jgi:signal transduction histidine kinase
MTAFRVIQESLHNATKYARAHRVDISIQNQQNNAVSVTVRDDGRGFDPSQVTVNSMGGTGIKGMKERADLVGGVFKVESEPGKGCCVYLVLPVNEPEQRH